MILTTITILLSILSVTNGFVRPFGLQRTQRRLKAPHVCNAQEGGQVGRGDNWIERAFPVSTDNEKKLLKQDDYNLGISGVDFETGPLSKRMYDAIMRNNFSENMDDEIKQAFTLYALDFTAKEAVKAALKQNGLELAIDEEDAEMQDEGMWGEIDSVQLLNEQNQPIGPLYDSLQDAVQHWTPGQGFNFIARQVPAKMRELSLEELLQALDPKGDLRKQAQERNMTLPDEDIHSLADLQNDVTRRSEYVPREATTEINAFAGYPQQRGYKVISRGALSRDSVNKDGSENQSTLMHVMDALVSHGALVVDLTDGGTTYQTALDMMKMWDTTEAFFNSDKQLPEMASVEGMESDSAKVGFADYGDMKFLETRWDRQGNLLPKEANNVLGDVASLKRAFDAICSVGKDVVRIATAAASMEVDAFSEDDDEQNDVLASQAATLLVDEVVDDATMLGNNDEGPISMTPHRLCRYTNTKDEEDDDRVAREVFGAHTDSTFITAVPVAAVSGFEVYDEAEERWYRPELAARLHWQEERTKRGQDPTADTELIPAIDEGEEDVEMPWHARYVVLVPGEFLQIVSRNEIPAAVHRVVAVQEGPSRLSAPVLLRGRPGMKLDMKRYLGNTNDDDLLQECDGMSMDEIHNAMQPSSFQ